MTSGPHGVKPTNSPTPGISAYDVQEEIRRGNLTIMYRAIRKNDGLPVAVKVVAPEFASDSYFVMRFIEAGERAVRLDHPNIARVYEAGRREDVVYVVRDLVEAESLADWLARSGPLSPEAAIPILRQLASALDYAHSQRLMHGDLNDRCIFIGKDGHVTITDVGLTQALAGTDLVKTTYGIAAPAYLAPERAQGQGPSRCADIYALGVLAYQMLAGRAPFGGEPAEVLRAQTYDTPPSLPALNRGVSATLAEVIERAMAKKPELRFNTATEFVRAFAAAAEGIAPTRAPAAERPHPVKFWQRPLFWAAVIAPVVGLFLAVLLWNLVTWADQQIAQLGAMLAETPTPRAVTVPLVPAAPADTATAVSLPTNNPIPAATPAPVASPTITLAPTPAELTIAAGSPFSNLVLAHGIDENHHPMAPGREFATGAQPIYLFFDYRGMKPGTRWGHLWIWGGQQLDRSITAWPDDWGSTGTGWVFYTPEGGFHPGPYEVQLLVNDQVVASTSFIVR